MNFRTRYEKFPRRRTAIEGISKTQQQFKEECDINNIMKKFAKTGELPHMMKTEPRYGEFADVPDYLEAMNTVAHANEQFAALSSQVRKRFGNDPQEFLAFATNGENAEEMIKMGLATRRPMPQESESVGEPSPTPSKRKKGSQTTSESPTSGEETPG